MKKRILLLVAIASVTPFFAINVFADTPPAPKVKVTIPNRMPPAEFEVLPTDARFSSDTLQCADASARKGNSEAYNDFIKKEPKCTQNIVDATVLGQKIAHITTSIDAVGRMLDSLRMTKEYTDTLTKFSGASFVLIPFGGEQAQRYEQVNNISMKCVQSTDGSNSLARIGTGSYSQGPFYLGMTPEQQRFVAKLKVDAAEIIKYVADERAKSKDGEMGFLARLGKAKAVLALKSEGERYLMPITSSALAKNHSYLGDENVLVFDSQTLRAFASEKKLLDDLRSQVNKKIKDLTAKEQEYRALKSELQMQLAIVQKNGYSCGGMTVASVNSNVSKPPPPQPPPPPKKPSITTQTIQKSTTQPTPTSSSFPTALVTPSPSVSSTPAPVITSTPTPTPSATATPLPTATQTSSPSPSPSSSPVSSLPESRQTASLWQAILKFIANF